MAYWKWKPALGEKYTAQWDGAQGKVYTLRRQIMEAARSWKSTRRDYGSGWPDAIAGLEAFVERSGRAGPSD
jgi:hypothetical protein